MRLSALPILIAVAVGLCAGLALGQGVSAVGRPVSFGDVVHRTPIDPKTGAALTPVASGEFATVNVWQLAGTLPAHFHRAHEEVVIVQSGKGEVQVGEHTYAMQTGDILLIPKNTVHSVHATGPVPFRGISVFGPAFDGQDRIFVQPKR
jgi:quercetin dioxygenase-like cupin family protein